MGGELKSFFHRAPFPSFGVGGRAFEGTMMVCTGLVGGKPTPNSTARLNGASEVKGALTEQKVGCKLGGKGLTVCPLIAQIRVKRENVTLARHDT